MNFARLQSLFLTAILVLTILMAGCAAHQYHDYQADIQKVQDDQTINVIEKRKQISALQEQASDQQTQRILDEQAQAQWFPSAIIGGVFFVILIAALVIRRVQNPPLTGAQLRAKTMAERAGTKPKANAGAKTATQPSSSAPSGRPAPASSPGAASQPAPPGRSAAWEVPVAPVKVLEASQAEVDAIPEEQRGVSFFTSRPLSLDHLVEIPIMVGGERVIVLGTKEESDAVAAGRIPRVRALSIDGETRPWYQWHRYDAYRDYWAAENADWVWKGGAIGASWMAIDRIEPALTGYLSPLPDRFGEPDALEEDLEVYADIDTIFPIRQRKAVTTLTARRLPHLKLRKLQASLAPVPGDRSSRAGMDGRAAQKKTGFQQPWIFHARLRAKKARPVLFPSGFNS